MRLKLLWIAVLLAVLGVGCRSDGPAHPVKAAPLKPLRYQEDPYFRRLECAQPDPCVKLILPRLVIADTHAVGRRIDAWLFEQMMAGLPWGDEVFKSRDRYADSLIARYQKMPIAKSALPWAVRLQWKVDRNDTLFFTGRLLQDAYLGGAHGLHVIRSFCFDRRTGRNLPLDSLLLPARRDTFGREAQKKFTTKYKVPGAPPDFRAAGYWFENNRFRLPREFMLDEQGLELIYNVYEVAPFSEGMLRIRFSNSELRPFLRPDYR